MRSLKLLCSIDLLFDIVVNKSKTNETSTSTRSRSRSTHCCLLASLGHKFLFSWGTLHPQTTLLKSTAVAASEVEPRASGDLGLGHVHPSPSRLVLDILTTFLLSGPSKLKCSKGLLEFPRAVADNASIKAFQHNASFCGVRKAKPGLEAA